MKAHYGVKNVTEKDRDNFVSNWLKLVWLDRRSLEKRIPTILCFVYIPILSHLKEQTHEIFWTLSAYGRLHLSSFSVSRKIFESGIKF
jgi:hypothetical protein